jgi:hypothetical protein
MKQPIITNPEFWIDRDGEHPVDFTVITVEDIKKQRYKPDLKAAGLTKRSEVYVRRLAIDMIKEREKNEKET